MNQKRREWSIERKINLIFFIVKKKKIKLNKKKEIHRVSVSLDQLIETLHNLCMGQSSNPGHLTYPHLIV